MMENDDVTFPRASKICSRAKSGEARTVSLEVRRSGVGVGVMYASGLLNGAGWTMVMGVGSVMIAMSAAL